MRLVYFCVINFDIKVETRIEKDVYLRSAFSLLFEDCSDFMLPVKSWIVYTVLGGWSSIHRIHRDTHNTPIKIHKIPMKYPWWGSIGMGSCPLHSRRGERVAVYRVQRLEMRGLELARGYATWLTDGQMEGLKAVKL